MSPKTNLRTDWSVDSELYPRITHYYGDIARQIMLGIVALMMLGAPFYSDSLRAEFPFEIAAAIIVVALAALTNPAKRAVVAIDALVNGSAAAVFGLWAFMEYGGSTDAAFILRDVIALLFLFAFYFSLKTYRAMLMHQVGAPDSDAEFQRDPAVKLGGALISDDAETFGEDYDPLRYEKDAVKKIMRSDRGD